MQNIHYEKNIPALALVLAAIIDIFHISNHGALYPGITQWGEGRGTWTESIWLGTGIGSGLL
jgi:hypothetical protein